MTSLDSMIKKIKKIWKSHLEINVVDFKQHGRKTRRKHLGLGFIKIVSLE